MDFNALKLLVLDVDGVLTDGRLVVLASENGAKGGFVASGFHTQDGFAIKFWRRCGGQVALISGRRSQWVEVRARELGIDWCRTGVGAKREVFDELLGISGCLAHATAYLGDDYPDLDPMSRCGFPMAVANAVPAVKRAAQYITRRLGGFGAVSEAVEFILRKQRRWSDALQLVRAHEMATSS